MGIITIFQFTLIGVVVAYLTGNMLHIVRLQSVKGPLRSNPLVSVCVPVRNEERDVRTCLESLLKQDYPQVEVIAVDDHSTDATSDILKSLTDCYSNFKFISGEPLPQNWYGKPFALHQAVRHARGEYLLFTDADPVFKSNALTSAVCRMQNDDLDFLTLMPGATLGSFWERVVQPVIFTFVAGLTRFRKINSREYPNAMGIGAFLMFRRSAYEKLGGHERVKQKVVEDIELAKCAKSSGLKLLIADGKEIISIRMYHSLKEIWTGWRKNVFTALKRSVFWTFYHMFMVLGFQVTPYGILLYNLLTGQWIEWTMLSVFSATLVWVTGIRLCDELKLELHYTFWFPLGAVIVASIMLNSMLQSLFKKQIEWRGRIYKES